MLPTFVIGLREGLEASLIVGIIAAFLRVQGRKDLLRLVWIGVGIAVVLCAAIGVTLKLVSQDLPQKQQEGLETVVGALAVVLVTYMIVWMRRHSRDLKKTLEGAAAGAVASGSGLALVGMAFLAVLREGFETAVFLLAAFNESSNATSSGLGAALGIAVAIVLGYGIYRGGVRINLSKFFRVTGVVLAVVAAGLVVSALHTAHEAGWLDAGQQRVADLSGFVRNGSIQSSLLTGMLGVQPYPVRIEVIGWLVYLVPVALYVGWPPGRALPRRTLAGLGAGLLVAAGVLAFAAPSQPSGGGTLNSDGLSASLVTRDADSATVDIDGRNAPLASGAAQKHLGVIATVYSGSVTSTPTDQPASLSAKQIAELNSGRLPIGVKLAPTQSVPVSYAETDAVSAWIEPETGALIDVTVTRSIEVTASLSIGATDVGALPATTARVSADVATAAATRARHDLTTIDRRQLQHTLALLAFVAGAAALLVMGQSTVAERRRRRSARPLPANPLSHVA